MATYLSDIGETPSILSRARRVLVIGCSGGGKTTLARWLSAHYDLPFVSMDQAFFWLPGWISRPRQDQRALIAEKIEEPKWIMDGTNPSSFDLRVPRADLVIWVRMPRHLCLWGVTRRWMKWRGQARPEMTEGCAERVSWEFIRYIWTFERKFAPKIATELRRYPVPVLEITNRAQIRHLLDLLAKQP